MPADQPTQSQLIGQAMIGKAVGSGKVTAVDVAHKVFAALEADLALILQGTAHV